MQLNLTQPNLMNCRRLFLEGYEVNMSIGVYDHEKNAKQRVIFDIDLYIPMELNTPKEDRLEEVVDYQFMRETVNLHAHNGHVQLQETLCDKIAGTLLAHPKVMAVRVKTSKPEVYADCLTVGVDIFRVNSN
ncbi:MAG: dihydroneopterin aldolase [Sheuella sp.]|nr:dihydroneopterin aldolase [Sheuella sp.]